MERYQPDTTVAVEDYRKKGSRHCRCMRELINGSRNWPQKGASWLSLSPGEIRKVFALARTKHQVAEAIVAGFPELEPYLPPVRTCWMPEDPRMAMFDAVALMLGANGYEAWVDLERDSR
jgi:hypothetical protein